MSAHGKYMGVQITDELESASGGTSKNTERKRARGTHGLESTEGGTSEDTKKASERGVLTGWGVHQEGREDTKRKRESEGHSHSGERIMREK